MTLCYQKGRINTGCSAGFCRIGAVVVFFLEITWAVTLFLQVCLRYVSNFFLLFSSELRPICSDSFLLARVLSSGEFTTVWM